MPFILFFIASCISLSYNAMQLLNLFYSYLDKKSESFEFITIKKPSTIE